ncbi:putative ribonuclease H-like domain-containing protein [Tanacetum coccineum]
MLHLKPQMLISLVMSSLFDYSSKNACNDEPQPFSDAGKKDDEGASKESDINDQERPENSSQDINTAGPSINTASTNINTGSLNINTVSSNDPSMLSLEETDIFDGAYDDEDVGAEADLNNLETTINVKLKKVIQALTDSSWIEAMQEELLQFKLQKVWTLVDLPKCKRAIGTKWVYKNNKDERGYIVRNKARLVAQDQYVADILKNFDFVTVKTTSTPMEPNKALVKDEEAEDVDVNLYK